MKYILFGFSITLFFTSCQTQKRLMSGNEVYSYVVGNDTTGPIFRAIKYKVKAPMTVSIVDNTNYLIIKVNPGDYPTTYQPLDSIKLTKKDLPSWKDENIGSAYFSESGDPHAKKSLWYRDKDKFVLQTATIPIKIRSAIRKPELLDSIPSQTETGFSVGFLTGYKLSWNKFRTEQNIFGLTTDKFSITPGVIVAFGAADLSAIATRPKIVFPRKAPMLTFGGSVVFGFNSINVGYAFGWDYPLGPAASTWLYKGKMWSGIIISLDLIK